jgi:ComF family protein
MKMKLFGCHQLCLLCHETTTNYYGLCENCTEILPAPSEICTLNFNKTIILFDYQFPFSEFITKLKFSYDLTYAKLLGLLLAKTIPTFYENVSLPQLIIPVPLHNDRLKERGFNQSLEIAKTVSKKLKIPINKHSLYRKINTPAQSSLSKIERMNNLKNAFDLKNKPLQKHVVILDDVITTGQTLNEMAKILLHHGIEKIDAWCCARTPLT